MSEEDQECASFLMTLKYRNIKTSSTEQYIVNSIAGTSINSNDISTHNSNRNLGSIGDEQTIPLATPDDFKFLNAMQCFIRSRCCEFFVATSDDIQASSVSTDASVPFGIMTYTSYKPLNKKICTIDSDDEFQCCLAVGQIGIRCSFCRSSSTSTRASRSTFFPFQLRDIYCAVHKLQYHHLSQCSKMPIEIKNQLEFLNRRSGFFSLLKDMASRLSDDNARKKEQEYWIDSGMSLGLTDTADGIRFLSQEMSRQVELSSVSPQQHEISVEAIGILMGETTLVLIQDKDLIPDYLFLAMAQMKHCRLSDADRIGCYKGRELGFLGMCCKHCGGQPGFGKYFPASVRSLAQTTTSQTIVKHIGHKCRLCPENVRSSVLALQEGQALTDKVTKDSKSATSVIDLMRPRYGSRKVFFQRIWERLHSEPDVKIKNTEDSNTNTSDTRRLDLSSKVAWFQGRSVRSFERSRLQLGSHGSPRESDASSENDTITDLSGCPSDEENTQCFHNYRNMHQDGRRNHLSTDVQFKRKSYGEVDDQDSYQSFRYQKMGRLIS